MVERSAIFFLHALGSSRRACEPVGKALGNGFEVVGVDLPGFGDAPAAIGVTVADTVDHVIRVIRAHGAARWLLVGHSMGGKIATIVAARTLSGEAPLFGLAGVVLLAGSPPSPEPMDEARRQTMLSWAKDGPLGASAARSFIDGNVGAPLHPRLDALAIEDLRGTTREAWLAWLERGSREDWSQAVGTLDVPAVIVAGGADGDLGADGQRQTNARVYPAAAVVTLAAAGHLLPLERPAEVAQVIAGFWRDHAGTGPAVPADFARIVASGRTSARTRAILAGRALATDPAYAPRALSAAQLGTLRAVADRVVPQNDAAIDLAARVDRQLAEGKGDGWRLATMPADTDAYRVALDALGGFAAMDVTAQDDRLGAIADGRFAPASGGPSPELMRAWFEDARTDLVRHWLAHPATLARIGCDAAANGGDGLRKQGFDRLAAGEREGWEPAMGMVR